MRHSSAQPLSIDEARALIGVGGPLELQALSKEALTSAFRTAVKAARPDMPGGDPEQFRRVIEAYRLIQSHAEVRLALPAPVQRPAPPPVVSLTPHQALWGASVTVVLRQRRLTVHVPAGLRTGEHLRLKGANEDGDDLYLPVLIRPHDGLTVMGDDLFTTWPAAPRLLQDGGRIEIETHSGLRDAWITAGLQAPIRLRLKGLGLPARGSRAAGSLFVTLTPSVDTPSAAEDLLLRFTRVWAPERLGEQLAA